MALSANRPSKRRKDVNQQQVTQWQQWTHFAGLDWAKDHHDVVVVDRFGQIVLQFRISEDAAGWQHLREKLQEFSKVAVAIETSHGAVVERLLQLQLPVYPVNPKAAKQYRNRKAPSGTKTDFLDAWSLADALRVDGHGWPCLPDRRPRCGRGR